MISHLLLRRSKLARESSSHRQTDTGAPMAHFYIGFSLFLSKELVTYNSKVFMNIGKIRKSVKKLLIVFMSRPVYCLIMEI